jgi:hypothetical protein
MFRTLVIAGLLLTLLGPLTAGEPKEKWPSAQAQLDVGLSLAKTEGKRVYLELGSPTCDCCRAFDLYMNDPEVVRVLSKHLVLVRVRGDKSDGAGELHKRLGPPYYGIPVWWVLDANGEKVPRVGDPFGNVGIPVNATHRANYVKALRVACPKMTDEEAALLERKLREAPWSVESEAAQQIEDAAGTKLLFAKALLQDGKRDSATKWLERVVKESQGTKAAGEAARLLADLRP